MNLAALRLPVPVLVAGLLLGCHGSGFLQETHHGSGVAAEETRTLGAFHALRLAVPADVVVVQGPAPAVVLRGDDNLLALLETRVEGDALVIEMDGSYRSKLGLDLRVTTPRLSSVSISGSGDVRVEGLDGESFGISVAGSGDVTAAGRVDKLDASISGSGDLFLFELQAADASVSIAGSGDVRVSASSSLDVSIAGSGDVKYRGDPRLSLSVAGSGRVVRQ